MKNAILRNLFFSAILCFSLAACNEQLETSAPPRSTSISIFGKETCRREIPLTSSRNLTLQFMLLNPAENAAISSYQLNVMENENVIQAIKFDEIEQLFSVTFPLNDENTKITSYDYNFDGYQDFCIYAGKYASGSQPYFYNYFIWNPETNAYEYFEDGNAYLNDTADFDDLKKEVYAVTESGGWNGNVTSSWSKWSNTKLYQLVQMNLYHRLIDGADWDTVTNEEVIRYVAISERINGELRVTDEYIQPNFDKRNLLQTQNISSPAQKNLELRFYGYAPDVSHAGVSEIEIYSHGKQIQTIAEEYGESERFSDFMKSAKPLSVPRERVAQMQDYNFDGCMDFGTVVWTDGTIGSIGYIYHLWNPEKQLFEQYQNPKGYLNQNTVYNPDKKQIETEILNEDSLEGTRKCVCIWVNSELKEIEDDQ